MRLSGSDSKLLRVVLLIESFMQGVTFSGRAGWGWGVRNSETFLPKTFAKLSSSWLVQPSSAELRFALILVITVTHPTTHPPPGESSVLPLLDHLGS